MLQRAHTEPIPPSRRGDTSSSRTRKTIPKTVRIQVWRKYCGEEYFGVCFTCKERINVFEWECSHVKADCEDGEPTVTNLRPCCGACNRSMGSMNMKAFCILYEQPGLDNFMTQKEADEYKRKKKRLEEEELLNSMVPITTKHKLRGNGRENHTDRPSTVTRIKCNHVLPSGKSCSRSAQDGKTLCGTHLGVKMKVDYIPIFLDLVSKKQIPLTSEELVITDEGEAVIVRNLVKCYNKWIESKPDNNGSSLSVALRLTNQLTIGGPKSMKWRREDGTKGTNVCALVRFR